MFGKKPQPAAAAAPAIVVLPASNAAVVDHIAAGAGALILILGLIQFFAPWMIQPFTGLSGDIGAQILAIMLATLGSLLILGGISRLRVVSIFAGEYIVLLSIAALVVTIIEQQHLMILLTYAALGLAGLLSSGFARLTDKADLKRDLRLIREQANIAQPQPGITPMNGEKND